MATYDGLTALPGAARANRNFAVRQHPKNRPGTPAAQADTLRRLRRQRAVERICRTPRLVAELLDEIGRHHGLAADIDQRLGRYAALDRDILAALGGDRFPSPPLRLVGRAQ